MYQLFRIFFGAGWRNTQRMSVALITLFITLSAMAQQAMTSSTTT